MATITIAITFTTPYYGRLAASAVRRCVDCIFAVLPCCCSPSQLYSVELEPQVEALWVRAETRLGAGGRSLQECAHRLIFVTVAVRAREIEQDRYQLSFSPLSSVKASQSGAAVILFDLCVSRCSQLGALPGCLPACLRKLIVHACSDGER